MLEVAEFEEIQTESLDLRNDAIERRLILEDAGEHSLTSAELRGQRREGGQHGRAELPPHPDPIDTWQRRHIPIVASEPVIPRHRIQVIGAWATATSPEWSPATSAGDGARASPQSIDRWHRAWRTRFEREC